MTPAQIVLAVVLVGAFVVDAQLLSGQVENTTSANKTNEGLGIPVAIEEIAAPKTKEQRLPEEGDTYIWEHYLDSGEVVSERAFVPNNNSVIVVRSRDRDLKEQNITRTTSIYHFTETTAVVAIIPWRLRGPCLIQNTSLTYIEAIELLITRNGSTIESTNKVAIDANVAPLTSDETIMFLESNPGLRRSCSFRPIVLTTDSGENLTPFSNSTSVITTLTLEADVTIIIPDRPVNLETTDIPNGARKNDFHRSANQGSRWGFKF